MFFNINKAIEMRNLLHQHSQIEKHCICLKFMKQIATLCCTSWFSTRNLHGFTGNGFHCNLVEQSIGSDQTKLKTNLSLFTVLYVIYLLFDFFPKMNAKNKELNMIGRRFDENETTNIFLTR